MANRAYMEVLQRELVRWQIVGAVVRQDTLATTVKRQILARLEAMAKHAKMEVLQREVVRWQIVGAVVRLGTQATTVKPQILARLEAMAKHAKMEVSQRHALWPVIFKPVNSVAPLQGQVH